MAFRYIIYSSQRVYPRNFITSILIFLILLFLSFCTPVQSENSESFLFNSNRIASSPFNILRHKGHFSRFLLQFAHVQATDFCPFSFYLKKLPLKNAQYYREESLTWHLNSMINEDSNLNSSSNKPLISFIHEAETFTLKRNKTKKSTKPSFDIWDGKPIHKLTAQCNTFIYPLIIKWSHRENENEKVEESLVESLFKLGNFARDRFIIFVNHKEETPFREIIENLPSRKIRFLIGILLDLEENKISNNLEYEIPRMSFSRINLKGIHFRMSAVTIPPLIMQYNGQIYDGMMKSLYNAAGANFNYTYETTEEKEGTGRKLPNGTWIGSLADLKKGRFDMAAVIRMSGQRQGHIDITNYLWNDQPVFLVALPQAYIPLTALISPFTPSVWCAILVSFMVVVSILFVSTFIPLPKKQHESHKKHPNLSNKEKLYQSLLTPFSLFLDQGVEALEKTRVKLVIALWMMLAFVLGVGYKDKLFSFLTFPQEEVIPRTLLELHERSDYKVNMYYWKSALFNMLNSSEYPVHQSLVQRLNLIPDSNKCVLSAILTQKTVCIAVKSLLAITMASNATISYGFEGGVFSERILNMDPMIIAIGLQKNSIFTQSWNIVSAMFRDTGIFSKWEMDTFADFRRKGKAWLKGQSEDNQVKKRMESLYLKYNTRVKPLELSNFYAILGVYIISIMFCLIVFLWENKPWIQNKFKESIKIRKLHKLNPKIRKWKVAKIMATGLSLPTGGKTLVGSSVNMKLNSLSLYNLHTRH